VSSKFHVVIPARFESSRLPGKPTLKIAGKPMIIRVVEQALKSGASSVVVATDDSRIKKIVTSAGYMALMTSVAHQSGSDRVAEIADKMGWPEESVVVNVQGDEPLIPPGVISQVAGILSAKYKEPSAGVATLFVPIETQKELFDSNVVKVVVDIAGRALYFSRAPVPWSRSEFGAPGNHVSEPQEWKRHVGIYAYTVRALRNFVALPASRLELIESLEQLRLLENGVQIMMQAACEYVPGGIDTEQDYEKICNDLDGK